MLLYRIGSILLLGACLGLAEEGSDGASGAAGGGNSELVRTWSVSLQAGFASTFQLTLGGMFGEGPDFQNRLSASLNNALRDGDSLTLYGWSTTDLPSTTPNWQAGLMYKNRLLRGNRQTLYVGGGVQRWLFPVVKTGAKDWLLCGTLNYNTRIGGLPISVSEDSMSLLSSTLPKGSLLYTQIFTQHSLMKRGKFQLLLRHGPQHTYAWGFYGAHGNRVVRYTGALVATWGNTSAEACYRQQFGLQDGIKYNRYWSFAVTRQFGGGFSRRNR